jgi:hypothetical protein
VLIAGGNAARQSILRPCWGLLMAIEFGEINSCQLSDDRRRAAAGISRVSRAIAVAGGHSALVADNFIDCLAQIAFMPP